MATFSPAGPQSPQAPAPAIALPFLPACLPAPRAGVAGARPAPDGRGLVPLPQRSPRDQALTLAAAGFPGLNLDQSRERAAVARQTAELELGRVGLAYLRAERSAGAPPLEQLHAVADQLRQLYQARIKFAHAELTGPVSLALLLVDDQERPLAYDPAMREALAQQVTLRATWLADQIASHLTGALVCFDEPFLDALDSPFGPLDWEDGIDLLARTLADAPAPRGLCVARNPSWEQVLALPVELVFFDAFEHGAGLIKAAEAVAAFLKRGGALGWGIVPNDPVAIAQERVEILARRFESTVEYLAAAGGIAPEWIVRAALISTSGSLAQLDPQLALQAAALCGEVSAHLRAAYRLDQ